MAKLAQQALSKCPNTKIAISGYSQGTMVVHYAVKSAGLSASDVSSAVLYGDPEYHDAPVAIPSSRIKEFCASGGGVYETGGFDITAAHLSYGANGDAGQGALFIIQNAGASTVSSTGSSGGTTSSSGTESSESSTASSSGGLLGGLSGLGSSTGSSSGLSGLSGLGSGTSSSGWGSLSSLGGSGSSSGMGSLPSLGGSGSSSGLGSLSSLTGGSSGHSGLFKRLFLVGADLELDCVLTLSRLIER